MNTVAATLEGDYTRALREYLSAAEETALSQAYELGRKAIAEGLTVLDIAAIHQKCLEQILLQNQREDGFNLLERAAEFFSESLSSFDMVLRGFRETNEELQQNLQERLRIEEELRRNNQMLAAAHRAVEAERRRYRELFDLAPGGYLVTDLAATIRQANSAAAELLGEQRNALAGRSLVEFVAQDWQQEFLARLKQFARSEVDRVHGWQVQIRASSGRTIPVALLIDVEHGVGGAVTGLLWLLRDVSDLLRAEEESAQLLVAEQVARTKAEAAGRFAFLAEASSLLVQSFRYEATLAAVARLAVPYLADWCFVHVAEPSGQVRLMDVTGVDRQIEEAMNALDRYGSRSASLVRDLDRAQIFDGANTPWLEIFAGTRERLAILRTLDLQSALCAPLIAHGRKFGMLTFLATGARRAYTPNDLALVEDLARRCALAVDSARLYDEVVEQRDRAARASRAKDEFFAILSHELRNPLTPVLGWARFLNKHPSLVQDPVLSEAVTALERNTRNIQRLVDDCLDLARISKRKIGLKREPVDLNQVILASVEAVRESARGKRIGLLLELSEAPLWVWGDRIRLEQVVMNLLNNGIKYTESGGYVTVASRQRGTELQIDLKDTGIGIAPDFLDRIFEPFSQGTAAWLASESGLGLGLPIARQIVEMHGGRVSVESEGIGRGSTFRVQLPASAGPEPQAPSLPVAHEMSARTGPLRLLVIDDSPDILVLMKVELEAEGHVVLPAASAEEGLRLAQTEHPDVVVSDIKMPGMDGYELIRRLRSIPELAFTPAIALTGFGLKTDVEKCLAAGYNACLNKPSDPEELSALIQRLAARPAT